MALTEKLNGWMDSAASKLIVLFMVLLVGGAFGTFQERLFARSDLRAVRADVADLEEKVQTIQNEVTAQDGAIDAMRSSVDGLTTAVQNLTRRIDRMLENR